MDGSLFLELEEELGLFQKITLCFLCPSDSGRVARIFIFGDELLVLFRKIEISSLRDGDPRDSTPFQYIAGAGVRDEARLS